MEHPVQRGIHHLRDHGHPQLHSAGFGHGVQHPSQPVYTRPNEHVHAFDRLRLAQAPAKGATTARTVESGTMGSLDQRVCVLVQLLHPDILLFPTGAARWEGRCQLGAVDLGWCRHPGSYHVYIAGSEELYTSGGLCRRKEECRYGSSGVVINGRGENGTRLMLQIPDPSDGL